ncbi:hypothetical protein PIB30_035817 [Stylosanthes scabra]|uniref:DUF4283 domain-containing protein n=1 Tax=Stylosanthes scabra TaxID=79078 RepID=A0ABU6XC16_9FABA|nr:hypothetical protein [Stylosanthes scabra]
MGKKKSCQNVKVPRPLNAVEQGLYGWVNDAIFTQPSVVREDSLPELRCNMRLTKDPVRRREVMTRCRVGVSQLLLNCWGLLRTFERGCKLFGIFEESIQEFKWHYFKVLPAPGRRTFWLDDGGRLFPWVYWNRGVKDFVVHDLDPLEITVVDFLVSLPAGLPKKNNLTCRWILDNNDAVVGTFLDDLLLVEMKKTKLDRMMAMMADPSRMAPRAVLPTGAPPAIAAAAAAESSANPVTSSVQVPPPPTSSRVKKSSSKRERPEVVNVEGEEGEKEDPDADLRQKRR